MRAGPRERVIRIMAGAGLAAIMLFSRLGQADAGAASRQSRKDDAMEVKKGYAPVDGLRIYYEIHGTASPTHPPLVLLHGGGDTIETSFGHVLPEIARDRQVIAFEQQGYGHTADIADRPFSFQQSADDTAALLQYLHVDHGRRSWIQQRRHDRAAGGDPASAHGSQTRDSFRLLQSRWGLSCVLEWVCSCTASGYAEGITGRISCSGAAPREPANAL